MSNTYQCTNISTKAFYFIKMNIIYILFSGAFRTPFVDFISRSERYVPLERQNKVLADFIIDDQNNNYDHSPTVTNL